MVKINSRERSHRVPNEYCILRKKNLFQEHVAFLMFSLIGSVVAFPDGPTPEFLGMASQKEMFLEERED